MVQSENLRDLKLKLEDGYLVPYEADQRDAEIIKNTWILTMILGQ